MTALFGGGDSDPELTAAKKQFGWARRENEDPNGGKGWGKIVVKVNNELRTLSSEVEAENDSKCVVS